MKKKHSSKGNIVGTGPFTVVKTILEIQSFIQKDMSKCQFIRGAQKNIDSLLNWLFKKDKRTYAFNYLTVYCNNGADYNGLKLADLK